MRSVAEVTRSNIGRAALDIFSARGYSSATLAQIGAEVGLTRGAVLHHYHSKEELLNAVIGSYQQALTELVAISRTDHPPSDRQRTRVLAQLVDLFIEHRAAAWVVATDVSARRQLGPDHGPFPPVAVTTLLAGGQAIPLTSLHLAAVFGALTGPLATPGIDWDSPVTRQELTDLVTAVLDASTPEARALRQNPRAEHRPSAALGAGY